MGNNSRMLERGGGMSAEKGVVATGHPAETEAGIRTLANGGNAMDAAVAAAFVSFVVEPNNAGLGGYGHLSAFSGEDGTFLTVDHGPRAPLSAHADMFEVLSPEGLDPHEWPEAVDRQNELGPLAVAVPGAVAGLHEAHKAAGCLPFAQVVGPAIEAADDGVEVTWNLLLEIHGRLADIRSLAPASQWLLRDNDAPAARDQYGPGERLDTRPLARTLRLIAQQGPAAFYQGPVADAIASEVQRSGGIITKADLASYRPKIFFEQPASYRDLEFVTANDTVGYEALQILEHFPLAEFGPDSAEHHHLLAEAIGHAFVDNQAYYGDPDLTSSPINGLSSQAYATSRAARIGLHTVTPRPIPVGDPRPFTPGREAAHDTGLQAPSSGGAHGTTHIVTADSSGNMVTLITTIGGDFGSLVYVPEAGVLLNNSMMNYDPRPGMSNSIAPTKMPFFAVPAIIAARNGKAAFAAAGAGGYRILPAVLHTMVNVVDHGLSIQDAVDKPRSHCQGSQTYVDSRIPLAVRNALTDLGHQLHEEEVEPAHAAFGRVGAVTADNATGRLMAASSPPWATAVGGL